MVIHVQDLLEIADTLAYFSKKIKKSMMKYEKFVKSIIKDDSKPFKDVKDGIVLGGKKFLEKIREILKGKQAKKRPSVLKKLLSNTPIEEVFRTVTDFYFLSLVHL